MTQKHDCHITMIRHFRLGLVLGVGYFPLVKLNILAMLDTRHQHRKSGYHQYHKSHLTVLSVAVALAVVAVKRMLEVQLDHEARLHMTGDEYQEFETVYHHA